MELGVWGPGILSHDLGKFSTTGLYPVQTYIIQNPPSPLYSGGQVLGGMNQYLEQQVDPLRHDMCIWESDTI